VIPLIDGSGKSRSISFDGKPNLNLYVLSFNLGRIHIPMIRTIEFIVHPYKKVACFCLQVNEIYLLSSSKEASSAKEQINNVHFI
jgi:hypothetical protein